MSTPQLSLVEKYAPPSRDIDPLRVAIPLPHDFVVYPYGVAVRFRTNSDRVAEAARQTWAVWKKRFDTPGLEIRCLVDLETDTQDHCPAPPVMRAQGHLLTMSAGASNFACCDLSTAFAFASITRAVAADVDYLRFFFLEAMVYSILSAKYLVFIHAACIASQGGGILLSGESGAGKTSLAYACARNGWTYISDDASVVCGDGAYLVVLGDSRRFRFRDSAASLFPELKGRSESRTPWRGKPTLEVPTQDMDISTACEARPRHVVFLKRHADPRRTARLVPFRDKPEAARRLNNNVWPQELETFERNDRVIQRLLKTPVYELHYCRLEDAVHLLGCFLDTDCA